MVNKVYRSWDAGPMQFLYSERRECRAVTQSNEFWHAQDIVMTAVVLIAVWMPRLAWNDWLQCAAEIANFTATRSPRSRASHRRTGGLQIRYQWTATDTERLGRTPQNTRHARVNRVRSRRLWGALYRQPEKIPRYYITISLLEQRRISVKFYLSS